MPSASSNSYLVMAGVVAAGRHGLKMKMKLDKPDSGAKKLPESLEEALQALQDDSYLRQELGEMFVRWFVELKRAESSAVENLIKTQMEKMKNEKTEIDIDELKLAAWRHYYMEFI